MTETSPYLPIADGLFVRSVARGLAAEEAGFKVGDRIVKIDGKAISTIEENVTAIEHADDDWLVEVMRDGERLELEVLFSE